MECTRIGQMRHPDTNQWVTYPCGQCLSCRVKKQSAWELRNLLEYQTSDLSSFVTLTINEQQMPLWASHPARTHIRRFFDGLRQVERRTGVTPAIRFFGCLEYGGKLGRPHYHFLIYNQRATWIPPIPRKDGLPAHQMDIKQWPHGHIDVGTITPQSIRYVAAYLTKDFFQTTSLFRTIRPGIGFTGIQRLAASVALRHPRLCTVPAYFQLGERKYPLDTFTRTTFRTEYMKAGGSLDTDEDPVEKTLQRLSMDRAKMESDHYKKNAEKIRQKIQEIAENEAKKNQREIEISKFYEQLSTQKKDLN